MMRGHGGGRHEEGVITRSRVFMKWNGGKTCAEAGQTQLQERQAWNLELFKEHGGRQSFLSLLFHRKWKGLTLSCVPGQLNQTVE